jgi:exodeoxyribonuclease VII small subunit
MSTPKANAAAASAKEGMTFEASIKRLGEIVQVLERGDLPLEESLQLFEEGIQLSRQSQAKLDGAQKRVEELLSVDDAGDAVTRAFDSADD